MRVLPAVGAEGSVRDKVPETVVATQPEVFWTIVGKVAPPEIRIWMAPITSFEPFTGM
jgi:hypothetical protein